MEGQDWMLDRTKVKEAKAVFSRKIRRGKITDEQHAIELFFMAPVFIQKKPKNCYADKGGAPRKDS